MSGFSSANFRRRIWDNSNLREGVEGKFQGTGYKPPFTAGDRISAEFHTTHGEQAGANLHHLMHLITRQPSVQPVLLP